jgi:glutathione S-transferase
MMPCLLIVAFLALFIAICDALSKHILYDVPVSNHGARIRLIAKSKGLTPDVLEVKEPSAIGGSKSAEFLKLNTQGKVPVLVTDTGFPIPESDCIARYVTKTFADRGPSFISSDPLQASLSDQICRFHDVYISPVQGSMYKAKGTPFSTFGTDRKAGLTELKKQLMNINDLVQKYQDAFPYAKHGNYLCGAEISVADATLFPTMVFCDFMLPQFFSYQESDYKGAITMKWMRFMTEQVPAAQEVKEEIEGALNNWKKNGRFEPIMEEMKAYANA